MTYAASATIIDPDEGIPVKAKVKCEAFRLDTGAKHATIAYTSSSGVVTFTDLTDGVWYIVTARVRRGVNPIFPLNNIPTGFITNTHVSGSAAISPTKFLKHEFLVFLTSSPTGVTGNAAQYTLLFGGEIMDQSAKYNPSDGKYTAADGGRYHFDAVVSIYNVTAVNNQAYVEIVTSNRTIRGTRWHPGVVRDNANNETLAVSCMTDMDADDTAYVRITVTGEATENCGVVGNGSILISYFSGWMCG